MNKLTNVIIFAVGAAVGSVVTWKLLSDKYEEQTQEEIEAIRDMYERRYDEAIANNPVISKPDMEEYAAKAMNYETESEEEEEDYMDATDAVKYLITPEEYGEDPDNYEPVTLIYYEGDGTVAYDDIDRPILTDEEIEYYIGRDSLNHFGEYAKDAVFVRNEDSKGDYEILRDLGCYHDESVPAEE